MGSGILGLMISESLQTFKEKNNHRIEWLVIGFTVGVLIGCVLVGAFFW
jgi:hypothetical protein